MLRSFIFISIFSLPLFSQPKSFIADKPLTEASRQKPGEIGKGFAAQALTLAPEGMAGVFVAKQYTDEHNGVTHILYRQSFRGSEVQNAAFTVHLNSDGQVLSAGGELFNAPDSYDASLFSLAAARKAVRTAVRAVATEKERGFSPIEVNPSAQQPEGSVRFAANALADDVEGTPIWYAVRGRLVQAWRMNVVNETGDDSADVIIEAASGAQMARFARTYRQNPSPKGQIYEKGSPQPNPKPGVKLLGAPPVVDRTSVSFAGDPVASPAGWVTANRTAGNNTVTGQNFLGVQFLANARITSAPNGDFSFPVTVPFPTNPLAFGDAVNTNLFYWVNLAHDRFYRAGFNEAAGNFQVDNFGRGGSGGDPMQAYAHYGSQALTRASLANAFFTSRGDSDGAASMIAMYVSRADQAPFIFSDGSLDATVIVHEYTHGVSTRLVTGCYDVFQCFAMGEAWSDFFSLEFTLPANAPPDGVYPTGEYFTQVWGADSGRTRPYSTDFAVNNLTFAALGKVIPQAEVHADGEIWVEALWEVRAAMIKQYGDADGRARANLLIVDGMKLSVPRPSMVDARDAILLADRVDFKGANQRLLWTAFAKRGFGALAYTPGPDSEYVFASFDVPVGRGILKILDRPLTAGETIRVLLNDTNLNSNSARVALTASSGDTEEMVLQRQGSLFIGDLRAATVGTGIAKNSGLLKVVPGDAVSAYYFDGDTGSGSELIQTTQVTQQPYLLRQLTFTPPAGTDRRITEVDALTYGRVTLPFDFPFFGKTYRTVIADLNGALLFDFPPFTSCTDALALGLQPAIAPLWTQADYGTATDGVYFSSTPQTATIRWQTVTYDPFFFNGTPLNFSVTLREDGQIFFNYGDNPNPAGAYVFPGCERAGTLGISNGRGTYAPTFVLPSYSRSSFNFLPPFGFSDFPTARIEAPVEGATVRDTITITGFAADTDLQISRVDLFIDGLAMTNTTATAPRPDVCRTAQAACGGFSVQLDLAGIGILPGKHTLQARVTNVRGGFQDFPDKPLAFTVEASATTSPVIGKVEAPVSGDAVTGTLNVRGYAYASGVRVSTIDTLIDGLTYPSSRYGIARTDICNTLTAPLPLNCPNVGFTATVNTASTTQPLTDGAHSLQIRVRDAFGRFTLIPDQPIPFTVKNAPLVPPVAALTSVKQGDTLQGIVSIEGYAYQTDAARVTSVLVVIDGSLIAEAAQLGLPAADVCRSLPNVAACPNIGFRYALDTRRLTNGPHLIQVLVRNSRGELTRAPTDNFEGAAITIAN